MSEQEPQPGTKKIDLGPRKSESPSPAERSAPAQVQQPPGCSRFMFYLFIGYTLFLIWFLYNKPNQEDKAEQTNQANPTSVVEPSPIPGLNPAPGDQLAQKVEPEKLAGVRVPEFKNHTKVHVLTPLQALVLMIETPREERIVIDVRDPEKYSQGPRIPDSLNIPLYAKNGEGRITFNRNFLNEIRANPKLSKLKKKRGHIFFVVADSTPYGLQAATLLLGNGYRPVYLIAGGMEGWQPGDYPPRSGPRTVEFLARLTDGLPLPGEEYQPGWLELGLPVEEGPVKEEQAPSPD